MLISTSSRCGVTGASLDSTDKDHADLILVGGGLANGLIALRLRQLRPELHVLLLEQEQTVGGNHTWSFHTSDVSAGEMAWVEPLIAASWPRHQVLFPRYRRTLNGGYHSVSSDRFRQVLSRELDGRIRTGAAAVEVSADSMRLSDGTRLTARGVIDGRGFPRQARIDLGYQKFVGLDLVLAAPHSLDGPILMDARCPQTDGYRFFYVLPWSDRRVLVEYTSYSDAPGIELEAVRSEILDYVARQGREILDVERVESGVLPIPFDGRLEDVWDAVPGDAPRCGARAGLFHATTGYSLPWAVRFADAVAALPRLDSASLDRLCRDWAERHWRSGRFFRALNRILFRAGSPERRFEVFQKFYRSPEPLIQRFYAGRLTMLDKIRMLSGRPPVPVLRALRSLTARSGEPLRTAAVTAGNAAVTARNVAMTPRDERCP